MSKVAANIHRVQLGISEPPTLTTTAHEQNFVQWKDRVNEKCLHELFQEQAERNPDAVAISDEGRELSYRELNERSNQLAHVLRELGVGSESLVAICLGRSLEMIVGMLGILKAGGAYLPMDPGYPAERLGFMLEDAQAQVLLTSRSLYPKLQETGATAVYVDRNWENVERYSTSAAASLVGPTNLAYIIYTSGSTGKPKGVLVEHAGMVNLVYQHRELYGTREGIRISQTANASFDSMGSEIWPALLSGATLCIAPDEVRADAELLQRWLIEQGITIASTTTLIAERLLALAWSEQDAAVRVLRFGGERFRGSARDRHYPFRVYNEYGPTEDTVWTTVAEVTDQDGNESNIGRAIANHRVYVLDENQNPVPVGEAGELCIGGIGLARGYLNRPELTAEKFIINPFSNDKTERLYRTGDLVRYLPEGNLAFLGRIDDQLKIRGYRIEPGEIEVVLNQHPIVRECVVIARENARGDRRLLAYVVACRELETEAANVPEWRPMLHDNLNQQLAPRLRSHLSDKLPNYMVPSGFVFLDQLPLTPNGKIDRRALPEPRLSANEFIEPQLALHCKLAKIWQDVLAVERIGLEDDFFELGGDSLTAVCLANRLREIAGDQASVALILRASTIAQLAEHLENAVVRSSSPNANRACDQDLDLESPKNARYAIGSIPRLPRAFGVEEIRFPTSLAQQSVWLLDQLGPRRWDYNIALAFHIRGDLNVDALQRSFSFLVKRHEVLRTTVRAIDGQPMQIVEAPRSMVLPVTDLHELESAERFSRARLLIESEAWMTFDLSQGSLLRSELLRLQEREHVLLVSLHHIIDDDWSNEILMHELLASYDAFAAGHEPELPGLPIQYGDYASWQREFEKSNKFEEQLQYWRNQLSDLLPLQLPTVQPAVTAQIPFASNEPIELSPQLTHALKKFSESEQVTYFMTMLAAFQTLLARYSGQEDIVVGSPVVSRRNAETEPLIGLFLNTLVLRTNLHGNPTFREVVRRVREMTLEAYQNQDLPFESIVEALAPTRDPNRNPLFQVMFNLMSAPPKSYSVRKLTLDRIEIEDRSLIVDLTMNLFDGRDGARGYLNYNADLFQTDTVRRMVSHFRTLLEGIVADPDTRISDLPLLAPDECRQLLFEWNDTHRDYPLIFLHQFIESQVELWPNVAAVVYEGQALTYQQLNQRANRLAHYLRKRGVGPDQIVGILAERSVEMWIGILATLKAGGGYLPLEPTYPPERLAFILQDAKPVLILSQRQLTAKLPDELGEPVFLEQDFASESEANPISGVGAENLAYIIYTSGSTGKPKGVLNSHGGLSNWLCWMQEIFPMSAQDAMLQKSPFSFDVSVREFFLPLSTGGRVIIAKPGLQGDSRYLVEVIRKHAVTAIHFVPPMLSAFLGDPDAQNCTSLRLVMCSGDALTFDVRDQFFATFPHLELHNMWGATEHAPESTYYQCGREPGKGIVPVGRPGANTQLYILDRMMQPVPVGVVGEAYLGGIQTALGYLARPELTAEKLLSNPFASGKLYKTGDLGRFRPDGVMEFVGRTDHQVKLRGFRVELGEIEAVLKKHPAVRDCVVIVHGEQNESAKRLVAYLVAEKVNAEELRQYAQESLPGYMVPAICIFLERIPVTSNGKIDRSGLPEPERQEGEQFVEPQTLLQCKLAEIWQNVLGVGRVGLRDNFFELGGHSLSAVRTVLEIERILGQRIPLATLFQTPTIEKLAVALQAQDWKLAWSPLVAIQPHGSRPPFFGVHTVSGDVMFYQGLAHYLGENQPLYGIQSEGLNDGPIRHRSMEAIAQYYIGEVRRVQPHGPYYLGGYCIGGIVAFEMAQQLRAAGEEVACLVLIEADKPAPLPGRTLGERIREVIYGAAELPLGEKFQYFVRRVVGRLKWDFAQLQTTDNDLLRRLYRALTFGAKPTVANTNPLRTRVAKMLIRVEGKYKPRIYPGRIILFRAAVPDDRQLADDRGWSEIAEGGVEIHETPGEHATVFDPQNVSTLAKKLDACLRARSVGR